MVIKIVENIFYTKIQSHKLLKTPFGVFFSYNGLFDFNLNLKKKKGTGFQTEMGVERDLGN